MRKKLVAVVMIMLLCMNLVPSNVFATESTEILYSGTYCGMNWSIDSSGHLLVESKKVTATLLTPPWLTYATEIKTATVCLSSTPTFYGFFKGCSNLVSVDFQGTSTSAVTTMYQMFYGCSSLESVDLSNFDTSAVTTMYGMFCGCSSLESVDLSSFDTSAVTTMNRMFYECSKLRSLDLSNFNTSEVTNMGQMFANCSALQTLDIGNFNTAKVTSMGSMFYNCGQLESLDLKHFNTSKVTYMGQMFSRCQLNALDISSFDTSNVECMMSMFESFKGLETIDLSHFNTSSVTDMYNMFCDSSFVKLDLSSFNTEKVTDMAGMFAGCSILQQLDISSFNTTNVIQMSSMFYGCSSLNSVDVSSFDTLNVTTFGCMFEGCSQLLELDLSSFDLSNLSSASYRVFVGCNSLMSLKTPKQLKTSAWELPTNKMGDWTDQNGKVYTKIPLNSDSIELRCDGWVKKVEYISGYSISLNGDIAINFHMKLLDELCADIDAYMLFTYPDGATSQVALADATYNSVSDTYVFSCDVPAAEMTDTIKAQIITTVGETEEYTYSVKTYADYILSHTDVTEYAKAASLVKAMLNYGGYSQKQFNHNTDNLANTDLYTTDTDPVLNDAVSIADTYAFTTPSNDIGLKYYGSSLLLNSKTTIRHYFTLTCGESLTEIAEKYTFKLVDGTPLTPKMKSGMICVDMEDINAPDLDEVFNLTVTNIATNETIAFDYSPMTYAEYVLDYSLSGQNLVNVIKAMYWYNQEANAYFPNGGV